MILYEIITIICHQIYNYRQILERIIIYQFVMYVVRICVEWSEDEFVSCNHATLLFKCAML